MYQYNEARADVIKWLNSKLAAPKAPLVSQYSIPSMPPLVRWPSLHPHHTWSLSPLPGLPPPGTHPLNAAASHRRTLTSTAPFRHRRPPRVNAFANFDANVDVNFDANSEFHA